MKKENILFCGGGGKRICRKGEAKIIIKRRQISWKRKNCCRWVGEHQRLYEGSFSNLSEHQPQRKLPTIRPNM